MTQTDLHRSTASSRPLAASFAFAVVSAVVVASLICLGVAAVTRAAGASAEMLALKPTIFVPFIVIGVVCGAIGWTIIRARARDPRRLLDILAPVLVLVSFVPDILLGVTQALPGTTWTGVIGLMVMHLVVAVCAVAAYRIFLPVGAKTRT